MAGRIPQPWYRKGKNAWYVHLHGKTIRLGKDKDEAFRQFHRLMSEQGQQPSASAVYPALTVGELAEKYRADLKHRTDGRTFYVANCYLKPFLEQCGKAKVLSLKKHHVETVIREHGTWNGTTENHVKSRIVALFNWLECGTGFHRQEPRQRHPQAQSQEPWSRSRHRYC